jgi:outer membrane protein TolC
VKRACYGIVFGLALAVAAAGDSPLALTMKQAVELALAPEGNLRLRLALEAIRKAQSRSGQARAALLPQIETSVTRDNRTVNLEAFGVRFGIPGTEFRTPSRVGPFTVFDARAAGSQTVFNLSAIRRYQASRLAVEAARQEGDGAREAVIAQVARAYLAALRSEARLEAARANVRLAERLLALAENQKAAGAGTGIDVTRARVQLSSERQLLLQAENERDRAHLELLRAMNLPLDTRLELTDRLELHPLEEVSPEQALARALAARPDWRAQRERERAAAAGDSAARWERLPSLAAFGNYGTIGSALDHNFPTRTYGVSLRLPLFDGGRLEARRAESASELRQEQIRTRDLRAQIELEIRLALDALRSAREQVRVADEGLELARQELEQAERRFAAGVAAGIELADAQSRLARARDYRIAALFAHESARLDFGQAVGAAADMIP